MASTPVPLTAPRSMAHPDIVKVSGTLAPFAGESSAIIGSGAPTVAPRPTTCTGALLLVVAPFPSSPLAFCPQAQTVPSVLTATACFHPLDICFTLTMPTIGTGVLLPAIEPVPSSPFALVPHDQSVPSVFKAT